MPEYALILCFLLTSAAALHKYSKVKLYKSGKHMLLVNSLLLLLGAFWDQFAIWRGHWSFNEKYLLGARIGFMPIEEFAFMLIVFYFSLVAYKLIERKFA